MAEELQYSSGLDPSSNKRKYDDQTSAGRRSTGFSAPIISPSPDSLPVDEIQLAKQRAQEIAARLFSNAEAKRPRNENGFDSTDDLGQKPSLSFTPSMPTSYGYPGPSKKIDIPNGRVGVIIGKAGETIKYLQLQSGAKIQVTRDMDADPNSPTRAVELTGTPEQIAKAEQLISDVLAEAEAGGSGGGSRRSTGQHGGGEQFVMKVPNNKVGLIIGKGGETIKNMQARTGARIQVIPLHLPPGDTSIERTVQIDGTSEQIEAAKLLVSEVTSENRVRNPSMGGGYSQQGYQARPPTSWAPPGQQSQQPGYGYGQPGAYPNPSPQYNMTQPPYSGYPPQPVPTWDPTTGAPTQQTTPPGGYDYYNQQQQQQQQQQTPSGGAAPSPADNAATYGYTQQGQGYTQDGYGGYQSNYSQPQSNPVPSYDQQQGYGNVANQTPETNQTPPPVQPSPNASYPTQGSTQPAYGAPQTGYGAQPGYGSGYAQKPPASQPVYSQSQQSPSAIQTGYAQPAPVQPGYNTQSGYAQPDSGAQRGALTGYGAAYGMAPYGSQPGYGGQQAAPYYGGGGGGYAQGYGGGDGNAVAPGSQAVQPSTSTAGGGGVAKTSPQS